LVAGAVACIFIVIQSVAVHADTFRDAVNAAYCIGVDQGEIDFYVKIKNIKDSSLTEPLDSKIRERTTFITNAMRARLIDAATVEKMKSAGYRESLACWKNEAICDPIYVCDEK
jgi:hypothetical protein